MQAAAHIRQEFLKLCQKARYSPEEVAALEQQLSVNAFRFGLAEILSVITETIPQPALAVVRNEIETLQSQTTPIPQSDMVARLKDVLAPYMTEQRATDIVNAYLVREYDAVCKHLLSITL